MSETLLNRFGVAAVASVVFHFYDRVLSSPQLRYFEGVDRVGSLPIRRGSYLCAGRPKRLHPCGSFSGSSSLGYQRERFRRDGQHLGEKPSRLLAFSENELGSVLGEFRTRRALIVTGPDVSAEIQSAFKEGRLDL